MEWYVSENGHQKWSKAIDHGKYLALMKMIQFDHSIGERKDSKSSECVKWRKNYSIYVLCGTNSIYDVIQVLGVN